MARHRLTPAATTAAVRLVLLLAVLLLGLSAGCTAAPPSPDPPAPGGATPIPVFLAPTAPAVPAGTVAAPPSSPPPPPFVPESAAPDPGTGSGSSTAGAAPPGGGWGPAALTAVPDPPRLAAVPADFAAAPAVAAAYLAAWCYQPADRAANTNLRNTAGWMTAAGWADDASRALDDSGWARTRAAGVSTVCGPATASVSPQGPNSPTTTWVAVSAQQARVRGGALIGQSPVSMMRRVLRAPDGRWLVDVRVMAG